MYTVASLDELQFLCHFCFQKGTLTSWHKKVSFRWEQEDSSQEMPQSPEEQLTLIDMLLIFNNVEELWDDRIPHNLCCQDCVDKIISAFLFYKAIKKATKQLQKLMQLKEAEIPAEYLELDEIADSQDDDVIKLQLYEEEEQLSADDGDVAADPQNSQPLYYLDASFSSPEPSEETEHVEETNPSLGGDCDAQSLDAPQNDIENSSTDYVTLAVNRDSVENLLGDHTADKQRKRRKISPSKSICKGTTEHASYVLPQFQPKTVPIPDADSPTTSQICMIDYVPVCVKGTDVKQFTEQYSAAIVVPGVDTVYKCQYCPQAFSASTFLITHQYKCHLCQFCTKGFEKTEDLFEHMRASHPRRECVICFAEYCSNSNLRVHIKRAHGVDLPKHVPLLGYNPPGAEHDAVDRDVSVEGDEVGEYLNDEATISATALQDEEYLEPQTQSIDSVRQ